MPTGMNLVRGIMVGIEKATPELKESSKNIVKTAYDAMTLAGNQAVDMFGDIPDPTITPVVDLDNVRNSAKEIASLMESAPTMAITGKVGALMGGGSTSTTSIDATKKTEVTFQQNNYSPKALSRLEIYRQTKNQLRQLEGV
jgi:hypothetical protein